MSRLIHPHSAHRTQKPKPPMFLSVIHTYKACHAQVRIVQSVSEYSSIQFDNGYQLFLLSLLEAGTTKSARSYVRDLQQMAASYLQQW